MTRGVAPARPYTDAVPTGEAPVSAPEEEIFLNPFEPGFFDNPYAQYRRLREEAPIHQSPFGPWTLTRYDHVSALLRDPSLSVEDRNAPPTPRDQMIAGFDPERARRGDLAILNLDPPDHTRIRRLVQKAFTPRRVEELVPHVQELVDGMLDAAESAGRMDVIGDLAFPLPFAVISEMLGMPDADRDQLRDWSHTLVKTLEPILTVEEMPAMFEASDSMIEHVEGAIEWKRRQPADDLLSAMIAAEEEGDRLSTEELIAQVILLFIAGHETTVNLIGNSTLALLRNPDQLARLRAEPDLIGNAVEELLRYDSPVQFSRRITLVPLEIEGHRIEPGNFVFTVLGAANHDPAHFGPASRRGARTRRDTRGDRLARAAVPGDAARDGRARVERPPRPPRPRLTPGRPVLRALPCSYGLRSVAASWSR